MTHPPQTSSAAASPEEPVTPPQPWLAAVLAVLVPGLGHVYAGNARRGALVAVAAMVAGIALVLIVPLTMAIDAYRTARKAARTGFVPRRYNRGYVYAGIVVVAVLFGSVLAAALRRYVAEAYRIPTGTMEPTIRYGDYLLSAPVPQGQVLRRRMPVVYVGPGGTRFVSRIAGIPGDTLQMRGKRLFVNGRVQEEPYVQWIDPSSDPAAESMLWQRGFLAAPAGDYRPSRDNWGPLVVPAEMHFMLSDNRDNAQDSRFDGPVHRGHIIQQPVWIYFSRDRVLGETRWERIGRAVH